MSNLRFTSDIVNDVLFRAGESIDGTSDFEGSVLEYVNRAYRALWKGGGELDASINEQWLWLKKDPPGVLVLDPVIDAGTVTVTNNSATITFSTAPTASVAGRFFQVDGHSDVFRVSTHTGGSTSATLDSVYTGDSGSFTYQLMKLEYTLASDVLSIMSPMRIAGPWRNDVDGIDLAALDRDYPIHYTQSGPPTKFAYVTETKVRFNTYGGTDSTDLIRLEYDYLQRPADLTDSPTEEPLVPLEYRQVLADYALGLVWTVKDDSRATGMLTQAAAGLKAMALDNKRRYTSIGSSHGHIFPRGRGMTMGRRILITG